MKHFMMMLSAVCLAMFLSPAALVRAADEAKQEPAAQRDRGALEKELAERLTRARLIGFYSTIGQQGPPKEDEYTLGEVTKGEGDKWLFHADLQFGSKVINVPLEVPVLWAGDTPVVEVTNFGIPGMGTYTARVMFYGEHYAGTWKSEKHGGYMWGHIQKLPPHEDKPAEHPAK